MELQVNLSFVTARTLLQRELGNRNGANYQCCNMYFPTRGWLDIQEYETVFVGFEAGEKGDVI